MVIDEYVINQKTNYPNVSTMKGLRQERVSIRISYAAKINMVISPCEREVTMVLTSSCLQLSMAILFNNLKLISYNNS